MKLLLSLLISLSLLQAISAQEENEEEQKKNSFSLGFIYSPRAFNTFNGDDKPFKVDQTFYAVPKVTLDKWAVAPFYNFGGNRAGAFVSREITKTEGIYVFGDTSLDTNFGAYGLGLTTVLYKDLAQGFVEIGGTYGDNPEPALLIGLYIYFGKTIKKW